MAAPTNKFIAVLVDGMGAIVGSPQFFDTLRNAQAGGGNMLRTGAAGLECYVYEVNHRITMHARFSTEEWPPNNVVRVR